MVNTSSQLQSKILMKHMMCLQNSHIQEFMTGGWTCVYASGAASGATNTANGLYAKATTSSGAYVHNWYTNNSISVDKFSTLHARFITTKIPQAVRLGLHTNKTATANEASGAMTYIYPTVTDAEVQIDLDLTDVTGTFYIKLNYQGGDSAEVLWTEVWAE